MAKILHTDALVTTSLRRAMIPTDQSTFSCQDIRDIMNEELGIHVLPMVLRAHEEYYVVDEDVCLSSTSIRYKIPYRATGNKLRDVQFVDSGGSQYEMTRVSLEDRPEYQGNYTNNQFLTFYLESDEVVLMQNSLCSAQGAIRMSYYLRPNELVECSRGGEITSISNQLGCVTFSAAGACLLGDTVTVDGVAFVGVACACVTVGQAEFRSDGTTAQAATSLASQVNCYSGTLNATATACTTITTITKSNSCDLTLAYTDTGCTVSATVTNIKKTFTMDSFPTHFSTTSVFDFIQGKSPNKIRGFDSTVESVNSTLNQITFEISELKQIDLFSITPKNLNVLVGDYILKAEETIVPQLPTELHPIIAQRTAVKLLEALGDKQGMDSAQKELDRMEQNALSLIDNRVEGAPQKITNRHSVLKSSLSNKLYRRRGL